MVLQPSIMDRRSHLMRFDLDQNLGSSAQIGPPQLDFSEGFSVPALSLDGVARLQASPLLALATATAVAKTAARHRVIKDQFHPRGAGGQGQAATRFVEWLGGGFFGGGRSKSAGTRKRARRRCTIAMLSPFLPLNTSLTRLGVPSNGTKSARVRPC
jgi:hypothetical protein